MDSLVHDASLGINFNPNAVDKNMIPSGSLGVPDCRALPRLLLSCRKYSPFAKISEPFHPTHWKSCSAWDSFSTKCSLFDIEEKQPVIRRGLLVSTRSAILNSEDVEAGLFYQGTRE